jgi:hypothetical protein
MLKSRWWDGTIERIIYRVFIIMPSQFHHIVPSYFYHRYVVFHHSTIMFSSSSLRCFTIVQSLFHRRTIVVSRSYHCVFLIAPSRFHQRTIVPSRCHHCTIVNGIYYVSVYAFRLSQLISWIRDIIINISLKIFIKKALANLLMITLDIR